MYREQNYIFSFTFVYKSKTACLIKHLFKKKRKKKEKTSTPFSSFFWILKIVHHLSYGFGFILFQWHYFICNNKWNCMYGFKLWALLWGGGQG